MPTEPQATLLTMDQVALHSHQRIEAIREIVEQVVAAQREKDARIAEARAVMVYARGCDIAREIAAAIRRGDG